MKEDEFRALLKLEGRELEVRASSFRGLRINGRYKTKREYKAVVTERGEELTITWVSVDGTVSVMETKWYAKRSYAIQKLIGYYYDRA